MPDQKTLLISSGLYSKSKLVMLKFDMEACSFETTYSWNVDSKYFAEGLTVANDD
jgi:glutamine cyclotransferase